MKNQTEKTTIFLRIFVVNSGPVLALIRYTRVRRELTSLIRTISGGQCTDWSSWTPNSRSSEFENERIVLLGSTTCDNVQLYIAFWGRLCLDCISWCDSTRRPNFVWLEQQTSISRHYWVCRQRALVGFTRHFSNLHYLLCASLLKHPVKINYLIF